MRIAARILRALLFGFLCLVLAVNLWLIGAKLLLHDPLPGVFGFSQALVLSGSMEPTFSAGDMLIFRAQSAYAPGDVVIFAQGDSFVTHRIVGMQNGAFKTKGDANNASDAEPLYPENIRGRLALVVPAVGSVLQFLKTPLGLLLLAVAGFALIEVPAILDRRRRKRVRK